MSNDGLLEKWVFFTCGGLGKCCTTMGCHSNRRGAANPYLKFNFLEKDFVHLAQTERVGTTVETNGDRVKGSITFFRE